MRNEDFVAFVCPTVGGVTSTSSCNRPLVDAITCEVTQERNGEYELTLEYPIDGANAEYLRKYHSIAAKPNTTQDKQIFDIYSIETDGAVITVSARHCFYRLDGAPCRAAGTAYSDIGSYLTNLIQYAARTMNGFTVTGSGTSSTGGTAYTNDAGFESFKSRLLDACEYFDAELLIDNFTVKAIAPRCGTTVTSSLAKYGFNISKMKFADDNDGAANSVFPYYCKNGSYVYSTSLPTNDTEVKLGYVWAENRDVTSDYDSAPSQSTINSLQTSLTNAASMNGTKSIEVELVDLSASSEKSSESYARIKLCDFWKFVFEPFGVETYLEITKLVYNVLDGRYTSITLGKVDEGLAGDVASGGGSSSVTSSGGGGGLQLGETEDTAYRGDRGKIAYEHTTNTTVHVTAANKTTWNAKQDAISDLSTIRSGAAAGATALQSVPSTYRTAAEQDKVHDATKQDVMTADVDYLTPTTAESTYSTKDDLSDHAGDTALHVTSAEKSIWTAKQDALTADTDYLTPNTAASTYATNSALSDHTTNEGMHVNSFQKTVWTATTSNLATHRNDTTAHVTADERSTWNAKQDALTADTDYLTPNTAASTYQPIGDYATQGDIPTALSELSDDSTHRLVTDAQIATWNAGGGGGSGYATKEELTAHTGDSDIHVTASQKTAWDAKADTADIPTALSELTDDSTHRLVTDTQIATWNAATTTLISEMTLYSGYLTLTAKTWTNAYSTRPTLTLKPGMYLIEQTAEIRGASGLSGAGFIMFRPVNGSTEISGHRNAGTVYTGSIYSAVQTTWVLNVTASATYNLAFQAYGSGAHWVGNCVQRIYKLP